MNRRRSMMIDAICGPVLGIGGFHAALHRLGHECVFATDIDKYAAETYEKNWGKPGGFDVNCDIREVIDMIPEMDIICAGFPCQPFSKSGSQEGFQDQTRGTLFHDICYLAEKHSPKALFLENVPNLVKHDAGNTFLVIEKRLQELGYDFEWKILSPHKFGIPKSEQEYTSLPSERNCLKAVTSPFLPRKVTKKLILMLS